MHSSSEYVVYGVWSPAFRVMFFRMNSTGSIFNLAATSSIIDWMPKNPCGYSGPRKFPETVLFV